MGRAQWWPGVSITTRDGQAHCLTYDQGTQLVRSVQASLNELRKRYVEEKTKYGHAPAYLVNALHETAELLQWLKPGMDAGFFGSFMPAYRRARGK